MRTDFATPVTARDMVWRSPPQLWIRLSIAGAALAMVGNAIAVLWPDRMYGLAFPLLTNQAIAQDLTNLLVVSPLMIVLARRAVRGSTRAYLGWLAAVTFTVYNYVIYTFSVHFGPLFPLWVAVLGLATYALVGGLAVIEPRAMGREITGEPRRFAAWFLIATAVLCGVLWLSDIIGALVSGGVPASVVDLGVPTNAVHVLDLAIVLPSVIVAGAFLLRRQSAGSLLAPVWAMFLGLTGLPILLTPAVAQWRGDAAEWGVVAPIAVITATSLFLFGRLTRAPGAAPSRLMTRRPRSAEKLTHS